MRAPSRTVGRARSLRSRMTLPEVVLWQLLRGSRLGSLRFRRLHPVGTHVLDFFCPSARLAVEVDGTIHGDPQAANRDARRDARLQARGIRVLRVSAAAVLRETAVDDVLSAILAMAEEGAGSSPAQRGRGTMRSMVEGALP